MNFIDENTNTENLKNKNGEPLKIFKQIAMSTQNQNEQWNPQNEQQNQQRNPQNRPQNQRHPEEEEE